MCHANVIKSAYNETVLEVRYVTILVPTGPIWFLFFSSYSFLSYLLKICDTPIKCGGRWILRKGTSPVAQRVEESTCNDGDTGDVGSIPGLGRSPGEGNGNSLQYSCLENSMDRAAWCCCPWGHKELNMYGSATEHKHWFLFWQHYLPLASLPPPMALFGLLSTEQPD